MISDPNDIPSSLNPSAADSELEVSAWIKAFSTAADSNSSGDEGDPDDEADE